MTVRVHLRCAGCGWYTSRAPRPDGAYGRCRCGGVLGVPVPRRLFRPGPLSSQEVEAAVRRMDPHVDVCQLQAGTVLLAALQEGTTPKRLIAFTAYPKKTVETIVGRLRASGVFTDDGVVADWWGPDGGIEFWADVCVALGWIRRQSTGMEDARSSDGTIADAPARSKDFLEGSK